MNFALCHCCTEAGIYTFRVQKRKNRPPELKNGIWGPKSVWSYARVIYPSIGNVTWRKKHVLLGSKRRK
jgi:hypothetical protein